MRNAVVILSLIVAVVAEAPYHIPRPAPSAPQISYPQQGPQFISQGSSQSQYNNNGYSYPVPNALPAQIQPAPQPIFISQPQQVYQPIAPQPLPSYPQPLPQLVPQPRPLQSQPIISQPIQSYGVPQFQPRHLPAFIPQPQPIAPQPQPIASFPQPIYQQPIFRPLPIAPQPQPIALQPLPVFQPQPISPPSTSYGVPQLIQAVPAIVPQPQIQIQPQPQPAPIQYQPQQISQGYAYQQSASSQAQNSGLSSYQADSNQYSGQQGQVHREALDDVVVSRIQDIIKDNEHSSAKDAGYLSLVSGVSLENAKPSVEILSFVHNSPLNLGSSQQSSSISQSSLSSSSSSSSSVSLSGPSYDYGLPSSSNSGQSSGSLSSSSFGFLPQAKPAAAYGVPR